MNDIVSSKPLPIRKIMPFYMDKLKLTERNLGLVFNSRLRCSCICCAIAYINKTA